MFCIENTDFINHLNNSKMEDEMLTIEELKQIDGFENISDTEAEKMIDLVYQFSMLAWKVYNSEIQIQEYDLKLNNTNVIILRGVLDKLPLVYLNDCFGMNNAD